MSKALAQTKAEEWRPVVGHEGWYEVSSSGKIRRISPNHGAAVGRILRPSTGKNGYPKVRLSKAGKTKTKSVHRLVLEAFSGPCPTKYEARHLDENKQNSRIENLRWGTRKENYADRVKHGWNQCGSNNVSAKLAWDQVAEIKAASGPQRVIAKRLGISRANISLIKQGKTWSTKGAHHV